MAKTPTAGDLLPSKEGIDLWFRDVSYAVSVLQRRGQPATTKQILSGISGVCQAGRVLAIMGPSGAGKTSLLDLLAGRKLVSSGDFCLGRRCHATPADIRRRAAYVQQDDAIMPSQTVREAVVMAALLTLPAKLSYKEKLQRAEDTLRTFHLLGCADTIVGDPVGKLKGISGGERKRCAVAMSAVREPQVLFLDEPTSGLDAHKAHLLVSTLKELAQNRHSTLVCTIHQPSSDIFALFDDLLLLLDGRTVYNGLAADSVDYFASVGFPCPPYANPADYFFMHVLASPDGQVTEGERRDRLVDSWDASEGQGRVLRALEGVFSAESLASPKASEASEVAVQTGAPFVLQFMVLLRRAANDIKRNPLQGKAQVIVAIIFGIMIGAIWWQVNDDQNGIQDRCGAFFMMTSMSTMRNTMGVLTTFTDERNAVLREQANGMYWTLPYFSSRIMVDVPMKTVLPVIFGTVAYWSVGFQRDGVRYVICVVILFLTSAAANSIGLFLACIFSDVGVAVLVAPMIVLPLMMFSGFVINPESVPVYLKWVEWISPVKYAFSGLARNEFRDLKLRCLPEQYRRLVSTNGTVVEVCPFVSGDNFIGALNVQEFLSISNCCGLLVALTVGFTFFAYLGLVWITRKSDPTRGGGLLRGARTSRVHA